MKTIVNSAYFFGFSLWKHRYIKPFFKEYQDNEIFFINPLTSSHLKLALKRGMNKNSHIYIWGRKKFSEIEKFAEKHNISIYRIEDGFIRSIALGSDLTQPYSLVVDREGMYFDPTGPSALETILNTYSFKDDIELIRRSKQLKEQIISSKISKYNSDKDHKFDYSYIKKTVALVVGQVEDDASIQYGANGMTNLELLQEVKKYYPDRYIIYKPHPDVLSGNRIGVIEDSTMMNYCDEVTSGISMVSVLEAVDEVHTMTSLTGFEALVHGKKVYTYGLPFYAGWGLTEDKQYCDRRKSLLHIDELIAATYLLYPRYISPSTKAYCEVEQVIMELKRLKDTMEHSIVLKLKFKVYSLSSRISQKLLSFIVMYSKK